MAHISGLIAAQVQNDPFEYCDVVCTTTYVYTAAATPARADRM